MSSLVKAAMVLGVAASVQAGVFVAAKSRASAIVGPTTGSAIPTVRARRLDDATDAKLYVRDSCTIVALMSVDCPYCRRMRHAWPAQLVAIRDTTAVPLRGMWMFAQDDSSIKKFLGDYPLHGVVPVVTGPTTFTTVGVFATPISYVVDSRGRLRLGIAGEELPSAATIRSACEDPSS